MLVAAGVVAFFILGMFLSMLGSSPKTDAEWPPEVKPEPEPAPGSTPFPAVADTPRV
jgi:hypothetical protein